MRLCADQAAGINGSLSLEGVIRCSLPRGTAFTNMEQDYLYEFITTNWQLHESGGATSGGIHMLQALDGLFPPNTRCYDTIHKMIADAHQVQTDPEARPTNNPLTGPSRDIQARAQALRPGESMATGDATITRNSEPDARQVRISPSRAPSAADQLCDDENAQLAAEEGSQMDAASDEAGRSYEWGINRERWADGSNASHEAFEGYTYADDSAPPWDSWEGDVPPPPPNEE